MNVRAATEADVDELTQIWHDGWHDAHARIVPADLARLRTLNAGALGAALAHVREPRHEQVEWSGVSRHAKAGF